MSIQLNDEAIGKMSEVGIPDYMQGGLIRYFNERIPTGDFLRAVLENDLMAAFMFADQTNKHSMHHYVMWLYNYAPGRASGIWGSPEAVSNWLNGSDTDED